MAWELSSKCSCLCPDKNSTAPSQHLVYLTWKKGKEKIPPSLPDYLVCRNSSIKDAYPLKSIKDDNEEEK